jgi:hypothetical protein
MDSQELRSLQEAYLDIYSEERAPEVPEYKPNRLNPLPKEKPLSGKKGDGSGYGGDDTMKDWKLNVTPSTKDRKGRSISQKMNDENPYKNRMMGEFGRRSSRIGAEVDRVIRGRGEARATVSLAQKDSPASKGKPKAKLSREIVRKPKTNAENFELWVNELLDEGYDLSGYTWEGLYEEYIQNEAYDIYDVILSHLLDEGYAETQEAAEVIMVNMSEDWRESIVEGFEKYPAKKVAAKIDRMYNDPNTDIVFGDSARRRDEMMRVMKHMTGEVHPLIRSESPKKSKAKEKENRTRGVSDN